MRVPGISLQQDYLLIAAKPRYVSKPCRKMWFNHQSPDTPLPARPFKEVECKVKAGEQGRNGLAGRRKALFYYGRDGPSSCEGRRTTPLSTKKKSPPRLILLTETSFIQSTFRFAKHTWTHSNLHFTSSSRAESFTPPGKSGP